MNVHINRWFTLHHPFFSRPKTISNSPVLFVVYLTFLAYTLLRLTHYLRWSAILARRKLTFWTWKSHFGVQNVGWKPVPRWILRLPGISPETLLSVRKFESGDAPTRNCRVLISLTILRLLHHSSETSPTLHKIQGTYIFMNFIVFFFLDPLFFGRPVFSCACPRWSHFGSFRCDLSSR